MQRLNKQAVLKQLIKNKAPIFWFFFFLLGLSFLIWLIFLGVPQSPIYYPPALDAGSAQYPDPMPKVLYISSLVSAIVVMLISWLGATGSSFTMENILDNPTRAKIFTTISLNPGVHFNELIRDLNLSRGQATWHLTLLKKFQMIRSTKYGKYLLFYPNIAFIYDDVDSKNYSVVLKSETRNKILELVIENPSITQNEIRKIIDVSQSTLAYHLAILEQEDLIFSQKKGRKKGYFTKDTNS